MAKNKSFNSTLRGLLKYVREQLTNLVDQGLSLNGLMMSEVFVLRVTRVLRLLRVTSAAYFQWPRGGNSVQPSAEC